MSDFINYNFSANNQSLDDINNYMAEIESAQADINSVFRTLGQAYTGSGADEMQNYHQQIQQMLDEHMAQRRQTHKGAQDQQDFMQHLDSANAADF